MKTEEISIDSPFPFGKYKGVPLAAVLADANYMQWLEQQSWMGEKYPNIMDYFRNGPAKMDSCTPDHNAMQVRYLDEDYCKKVLQAIFSEKLKPCSARTGYSSEGSIFGKELKGSEYTPYKAQCTYAAPDQEVYKEGEWYRVYSGFTHIPDPLTPVECDKPTYTKSTNTSFEVDNWDVELYGEVGCEVHNCYSTPVAYIELKPSISEDYPAILRKVKERREAFYRGRTRPGIGYYGPTFDVAVITDSYTGKSATLEQVKKMFASSDIKLLLSSEFDGSKEKAPTSEG